MTLVTNCCPLKSSWSWILIGVALGLGLTGSFLVLGNRRQQARLLPDPTLTPAPSSTMDSVTDWKTYTNADYQFSFQHPADWKIEKFDSEFPSNVLEGQAIQGLAFSSPTWDLENTKGYQLAVLPEGEFDHGLEDYTQEGELLLGGELGERWDKEGGGKYTFASVVFLKNFHDFRLEFFSTEGIEQAKEVFEKILGTFDFSGPGSEINCKLLEALEDLTRVSKTDCQKCRGEWELLSKDLDKAGCNPRTSDAGKICIDSGQCIGHCLGKQNNPVSGVCSVYKFVLGCNLEFFEGKPLTICRD